MGKGVYKHYSGINAPRYSHGMRDTRIYRIWSNMKSRCYNPNSTRYKHWGGRGIKVCDEWFDDFQAFYDWAMSNGYSDDLTIDRIDVNGNYEPSNCRWVDYKVQANNARTNKFITFNGETLTINEWSRRTGINHRTIGDRLKKGWVVEEILKPVEKKVLS